MSRKLRNQWMLSKDRGLEDPEFGKSKGKGTEMELGMMCT